MAKALMFLGTSSDSGKSIMAAAFCRIFRRNSVSVAPFKAQNMALNSGVTPDGREMGRAQIVQAEAAGIEPHVDMNPILLKPTSEKGSQVVVHGRVEGDLEAAAYYARKKSLWPAVTKSYDRLAAGYGVIVLEGAGSPVEMNLKDNDIVNLAMAQYADAGCVLVADIDRGGVFASIIGTMELLTPGEQDRMIGFIINKFRGDPGLMRDGCEFIREKTGKPVLGIVPMVRDLYIPGEDSVALDNKKPLSGRNSQRCTVGIIRLPHIANYTDFDPLECDPRFAVAYIESSDDIAGCDVIIIPGSKNVFFDYGFLRERGIADQLHAYYNSGGCIAGICGGYQMLGEAILDPHGVEGSGGSMDCLGLLAIRSEMEIDKVTERVQRACVLPEQEKTVDASGYEIHMGRTSFADEARLQFLTPGAGLENQFGVASPDGRVWGTYLHGLFDNDLLRDAFLQWVTGKSVTQEPFSYVAFKEHNYNRLADIVEKNVDVGYICKHIGL